MSGCEYCGCFSYNSSWYEAFGVMLCESCRKSEKLISKSMAKQLFLVTDKDIGKLGTISKGNPNNANWAEMKLYLRSQVEEIAGSKHGDVETIDELRNERRVARSVKRQQQKKEDDGDGGEGECSEAQRKVRMRLEKEYDEKKEHGAAILDAEEQEEQEEL
eukprot:gene17109-23411_t